MELYDVVEKLVGPIQPIGEEHVDAERYQNLKLMTSLVDRLIFDIDRVVQCRDRPEFSMSKAGKFADEFFDSLGIKE